MLKKFLVVILTLLVGSAVALAAEPHIKRVNPNLLENPSLDGTNGWAIHGGSFDSDISRTAGSGSILLNKKFDQLVSKTYNVTPGVQYTLSMFMRTDVTPFNNVTIFATISGGRQTVSTKVTNSKINTWEEATVFIVPEAGETSLVLNISSWIDQPDETYRNLWFDDFYFGVGQGFVNPPSAKVPFNGDNIKVDALANLTVGGEPFFPMCIFPANQRSDWSIYAPQGFNCNMWGGEKGTIAKDKNLGLLSAIDLSPYVNSGGWAFRNWDRLREKLNEIKGSPEYNDLIFFYIDNEVNWTYFNENVIATQITREILPGVPVYVLQGNHGVARSYHNDTYHVSDLIGTYVGHGGNSGGAAGSSGGLFIMNNTENQIDPVFLAQLNLGIGDSFIPTLWSSIGNGAKAAAYWADLVVADNGSNVNSVDPVDQRPWWPQLPEAMRQINQLLPVIRQPHWASWTAVATNKVGVGVREYEGESYLILTNENSGGVNSTVTLTNHPAFGNVIEVFSGNIIANADGDSFDIHVPANDVRVVKFKGGEVEPPQPLKAPQSMKVYK